MPGKRYTPRSGAARQDVYQEVTDRMIAALESGTVPWSKPWVTGGAPRSMSTGKRYRGVNTWLLAIAAQDGGWTSPWFGTYGQITERGGQVRKGERSTAITFWRTLEKSGTDAATGEEVKRTIPMLRQFRVFNAGQADGLPGKFYPEPGAEPEPIATPQDVLDAYIGSANGPAWMHDKSGQAFYSPARDEVRMPPIGGHKTAEGYYLTAFHEASHSTGHPSRLDRPGISEIGPFGSHGYAREELVAQMSASMLAAETGVDTDAEMDNSAAYLASWIDALKGDSRLIIGASAAAQKAADLILDPVREPVALAA